MPTRPFGLFRGRIIQDYNYYARDAQTNYRENIVHSNGCCGAGIKHLMIEHEHAREKGPRKVINAFWVRPGRVPAMIFYVKT